MSRESLYFRSNGNSELDFTVVQTGLERFGGVSGAELLALGDINKVKTGAPSCPARC